MKPDREESNYLFKESCAACGSSDASAVYSDNHKFCFSCGHYTNPDGERPQQSSRRTAVSDTFKPIQGEAVALGRRGISAETCAFFRYVVGTHRIQVDGEWTSVTVQAAPYYNADGQLVAQKWRTADKQFGVHGKIKDALLFGQHLWRDGGKKVVVTEGEVDCLSVSQLQGNKWPVVSVPNGADAAHKALAKHLEWLERFDEVILMFDMDEPGREAVAECAPLFSPGKCKVASLPFKDANECLQKGQGAAVIEAIWGAKPYRPDGIRSIDELAEEAEKDVEMGTPWFLDALTQATFGRRDGELYGLGAGTGIGKTDWFTQSIAFDVMDLGITTGVLYLEQPPVETLRRIAGKTVGKHLHVPGKATVEERRSAIEPLRASNRLFLYDQFGSTSWDTVKAKVRYMAVSLGCKHIYLDHLTALVADEGDERRALDKIMAELAGLALELKIKLHYISHLTRPAMGASHEEGGRVMLRHFRGSNAIGMWTHFIFGLERDQQAEDSAEGFSVFRVLKDRNTGQATGTTIRLQYDRETGLLSEAPPGEDDKPQFQDHTKKSGSKILPPQEPSQPWDDDIPF